MRKLLSSTAALSIALTSAQPWPLMAQTVTGDGSVVAADGTVLCVPAEGAECNPADFADQAAAIEEAMRAAEQAAAEAEAAAQAAAEAEEAAAQAEAEAAAAAQAEAEAAAQAEAEAAAQAAAEAEAAAQAEAEAAAQAEAEAAAQAAAEAEAAAQAEAEAAAQAEADAAAAQAEADAAAAAQAQAEAEAAAAQAEADAAAAAAEEATDEPAVEEPAADGTVTEEPATEEPVMEEPATDEAVTEDPATGEAVTEEPATEEATTEEATTEEAPTEEATTEDAATGEAATEEPATDETVTEEPATADPATGEAVTEEPATEEATTEDPATGEAATEEPATAEATEEAAVEETAPPTLTLPEPTAEVVDPAAGLKTAEPATDAAEVTPVEAPEVTEAEIESLSEILTQPDAIAPGALEAAASFNGLGDKAKTEEPPVPVADLPVPDDAKVVIETLTDTQTRRSDQEFAAAPVALGEGKKSGLSDLEKAGLVVLGALVVGAIINEGRKDRQEVVSNTGDRIVVLKPDGTYQVYKDDDAPLRQPGSTVRTETYRDGSTRTIIERTDGTQIVTVRDASGRVLRRAQYDRLGREIVLIDDFWEEEPVVVRDLPKPRKDRVTISTADENAALKAALAAKEAAKAGRKFTLRQIREIPEVRALAATIDVESVTFDSGSSAIKATEAASLAELGGLMQDLLDANPAEVFLIEGHTDAVGNAAMNLALSDRRAESVALALTEYFDIPPENMVVQGYGESELKIDTQKDERRNRRVVVRVITPLMKTGK